ncbi:hypothetical protein NQ317_001362 [Molorchus minor]|uniref:HMA domain-containing protein n=1 Tax=Molorchus minor TaxID=1323400 RepID=A0ABQ9J724_9CUCU|nr:hypothetical protein NQ317_001362 [Molorchus minor]
MNVYQAIMDTVACSSCVGSLTSFVNFLTTFKDTEEKITLYNEIQRNKVIIKLSNVLTFLDEGVGYSGNLKRECILDNLEYSVKGSKPYVKKEGEILGCTEKCTQKNVEMYGETLNPFAGSEAYVKSANV